MSDKKCECDCVVPWGDGTWRCRLCGARFRADLPKMDDVIREAFRAESKRVIEDFWAGAFDDISVTYNSDGEATLGTRRKDNVRPKSWEVGNEP